MIDEQMLDRWAKNLKPAITATFQVKHARELIRMARLGLWVEKYDALKYLKALDESGSYQGLDVRRAIEEFPSQALTGGS